MSLTAELIDRLTETGLDPAHVERLARQALAEDLDGGVDVTSDATVPSDLQGTLDLVARGSGVVAGLPVAAAVFEVAADGDFDMEEVVDDGTRVGPGERLLSVSGLTHTLLTAERTALNLLCHLSGIATLTRSWVDAVAGTGAVVRDTRKTTPGLRVLEKYAVRCGGGANHRLSLAESALVKDNHVVAAGGVAAALSAVRRAFPDVAVEVECDTVEQVAAAVEAGAELVLCDNMGLADLRESVRVAAGRARIEASGGLTLATARQVAETGIDFLAVGALTHSAPVLDIAADLRAASPERVAEVLLAIDVGNTQTVIGVFDADRLVVHWRSATEARRTSDELALLLQGFLAQHDMSFEQAITGVAVSSVVPALTHELREMCRRYFRSTAVIVEPGVRTGVPILTDNPKEVGADRIANALAAYHLYGGPAVVVDFGTSTNFDVISERGEFLGGAISPGIEISVDALSARGAQLRKVELTRPRSVIGKNTVECLQSGVLYGFAGQVDGIVERIVKELGGSTKVIATGGLAPLVLAESHVLDLHEPWLTLIGLRLIHEKNAAA